MIGDEATRDLLHTRLNLRDDLVFRPERSRNDVWYQVECRERGRFYRIGKLEYTYISLLDGRTTPAEAISLTSRVLGPDAFSEDQATSIINWLIEQDLVLIEESATDFDAPSQRPRKLLDRLNPFWLKIPFGNPDKLVGLMTRGLGWMHSTPAMIAAAAVWVTAILVFSGSRQEFQQSTRAVISIDNWIWLTATWLVLKLIHESSHAIACRRHGGAVRETGMILILLAPVAYVDVTSSLRFRSKWQRIQVSAAGMFAELTVAAFAVLLWSQTESEFLRHQIGNIVFMASVSTLLFNANPLMKFDGYYILSDLLGIPNLYTRGSQTIRTWTVRILTGKIQSTPQSSDLSRLIGIYGLACFVWRILICVGLLIAASVLFHGAGVVIAAAGLSMWVIRPLIGSVRKAFRLLQSNQRVFVRATVTGCTVLLPAIALLIFAPWPFETTAPGYVEFRDSEVVRSGAPGFVKSIHVSDGQFVEEGTLLVELENRELSSEVGDLLRAIEQSELRIRGHVRAGEIAQAQVERRNRQAMQTRLTQKEKQVATLTLHAPMSGRVMSRELKWLDGTWLNEGDPVLEIGDETRKEFIACLPQEDAHRIPEDGALQVRLRSFGRVAGALRQTDPSASLEAPHLSLTAPNGGPLRVREVSDEQSADRRYELLTPHLIGRVDLPKSVYADVPAGTFGVVAFSPANSYSRSVAGELVYRTQRFFRESLDQAARSQRQD